MTFAEQLFRSYSALQYLEFFGRIAAAAFCGAVIGFERSKRMKEAGIRTHVIVCCAAAPRISEKRWKIISVKKRCRSWESKSATTGTARRNTA